MSISNQDAVEIITRLKSLSGGCATVWLDEAIEAVSGQCEYPLDVLTQSEINL